MARAVSDRAVANEIARPAPIAPPPIPLVTFRGERARREAPLRRESTPPGEATIHVSIGRIEVRATPTAPARERVPAASPVMSLEEYLRTRAGRARA